MSIIDEKDSDALIGIISFETLELIQSDAEKHGFSTRWTSCQALRDQLVEKPVLIQSLMREERHGVIRAYRCLVLFSVKEQEEKSDERPVWGGVSTLDVTPDRYAQLKQVDASAEVRELLGRIMLLATGDISVVGKN